MRSRLAVRGGCNTPRDWSSGVLPFGHGRERLSRAGAAAPASTQTCMDASCAGAGQVHGLPKPQARLPARTCCIARA
eukprot:351628-Chlamydomonas_euryale.AAC.6